MTTNKPEVVAWYTPPAIDTLPVVALNDRSERGEPLIRLSDYEALQADRDQQYDMKIKAREQRDAVTAKLKDLQAECQILEAMEWLRGAINCTLENDKHQSGAWISTKHPRIRQIDKLLAAYRNQGGEK